MDSLALFCCSYLKDLHRARRLSESILRFNRDHLRVYFAVPQAHLDEFRKAIPADEINWLTQEKIFSHCPSSRSTAIENVPGGFLQQVVKAEAWRLNLAENLLVLDSDCKFIRPFNTVDFFFQKGVPYTVLTKSNDVCELSQSIRRPHILSDWLETSDRTRQYFGNTSTVRYGYGGAPFIWSSRVWSDLAEKILEPSGITFLDLVRNLGSEFMIYGEALIALRSIPIYSKDTLFKLYLYEEQWWHDRAMAIREVHLAELFMGVVYQSNWEYWYDHVEYQKSFPSQVARSCRRIVRRLKWLMRKV